MTTIAKLALALFLALTASAQAAVLPAAPLGIPTSSTDISAFGTVEFDTSSDVLDIDMTAFLVNPGASPIVSGSLMIDAVVDDTGTASVGSLSITGTVPSLGFNSGTLLTGTLSQFGFTDAGLEILFDVNGGDATGLYPVSAFAVVNFPFSRDFAQDFATSTGSTDVFSAVVPIPTPAGLLLILTACGAFWLAAPSRHVVDRI